MNFVDECNEYYYAVVEGTLMQFESEEMFRDYIKYYIAQTKSNIFNEGVSRLIRKSLHAAVYQNFI